MSVDSKNMFTGHLFCCKIRGIKNQKRKTKKEKHKVKNGLYTEIKIDAK